MKWLLRRVLIRTKWALIINKNDNRKKRLDFTWEWGDEYTNGILFAIEDLTHYLE